VKDSVANAAEKTKDALKSGAEKVKDMAGTAAEKTKDTLKAGAEKVKDATKHDDAHTTVHLEDR